MKLTIIISLVLLLGIGLFFYSKDGGESQAEQLTQINSSDVAAHNKEGDCWTIIDGKVYDVTRYIQIHPGGKEIIRACGIDASVLFNTRTTPEGEEIGSGNSHSSTARKVLERYVIGEAI